MGGSGSENSGGGGEAVAHSSVKPPQGSATAGRRSMSERITLAMKIRTATVSTKPPIVDARFAPSSSPVAG